MKNNVCGGGHGRPGQQCGRSNGVNLLVVLLSLSLSLFLLAFSFFFTFVIAVG